MRLGGETILTITMNVADVHCTENLNYLFPEIKLLDLVPNSYIHVSMCKLYIPRVGQSIRLQQKRQTDPGNI